MEPIVISKNKNARIEIAVEPGRSGDVGSFRVVCELPAAAGRVVFLAPSITRAMTVIDGVAGLPVSLEP